MSAKTMKTVKKATLETIEANQCRWPIGDPRQPGFHFCGAKKVEGRPYCAAHWQLSFVPGKGRASNGAPALAKPALAKKAA